MVNVGDMAAPGQPLFFLDAPSQPELHADLSESLLSHLREGMELDVRIDALSRTVGGRLREIVPKSDPATRTVRIKVARRGGTIMNAAPEYDDCAALAATSHVAVREVHSAALQAYSKTIKENGSDES